MRVALFPIVLLVGLCVGCAGRSSVKPVEVLDERTGVTVSSLKEPIELVPSAQTAARDSHRRTSFAYVGPAEWNRSGTLSYGLWVHIAPAANGEPGDIHAAGAVTLMLDDGPLLLAVIEAPKVGREPYRNVVSWGQTAYFGLTAATLGRMASSRKLELQVRMVDGTIMSFFPTLDAHAALTQYVKDRGITGD